jgi:hypothetical protein
LIEFDRRRAKEVVYAECHSLVRWAVESWDLLTWSTKIKFYLPYFWFSFLLGSKWHVFGKQKVTRKAKQTFDFFEPRETLLHPTCLTKPKGTQPKHTEGEWQSTTWKALSITLNHTRAHQCTLTSQ